LKDLPPEQREAWRELFDYYVFDADRQDFSHVPESRRQLLSPINEVVAQGMWSRLVNNIKK
ncbi:MAG: cupin-like domain-containing protein, partial [Gammaproteobacteria bacterium]|nr:cupin-like domain-containing protein [Gammaproteobacteria bacterium]